MLRPEQGRKEEVAGKPVTGQIMIQYYRAFKKGFA
jgi:hypothetical protein